MKFKESHLSNRLSRDLMEMTFLHYSGNYFKTKPSMQGATKSNTLSYFAEF